MKAKDEVLEGRINDRRCYTNIGLDYKVDVALESKAKRQEYEGLKRQHRTKQSFLEWLLHGIEDI